MQIPHLKAQTLVLGPVDGAEDDSEVRRSDLTDFIEDGADSLTGDRTRIDPPARRQPVKGSDLRLDALTSQLASCV